MGSNNILQYKKSSKSIAKKLEGMVKMKELIRKHWITLLGAIFTFMAFSYSFKYAVDKG